VYVRRLTFVGERKVPGRSAAAVAAAASAAAARSGSFGVAVAEVGGAGAGSVGVGVKSAGVGSAGVGSAGVGSAGVGSAGVEAGEAAAEPGSESGTEAEGHGVRAVSFAEDPEDGAVAGDSATAGAAVVSDSMSDRLREEDAESVRARQGEQLLVMDRFAEFTVELSGLQRGKGGGGGGGKKRKGKGKR